MPAAMTSKQTVTETATATAGNPETETFHVFSIMLNVHVF